ncbi:uncharacterized protein LOC128954372 [Oppia nitens]|uniref:uncharacterized protein LOC128954372 n=1 Tax=Oppia nitens TaxID=1686743 RepID=UPI0023DB299F|nr:uncharacterized protein LOC128954372 [Oppia nitens]
MNDFNEMIDEFSSTLKTTTKKKKKDSFDRFGDDLTELLLQYLPLEDRLRLQSVSKQWLALIFNTQTQLIFDDKLLQKLFLYYRQTYKLFESIVKNCPNITTVTISDVYFSNIYFELLIKYCCRLRHLYIKPINSYQLFTTDRIIKQFCHRFDQQLHTFKLNNFDSHLKRPLFYKLIDCMPNLKSVDFTDKNNLNIQLSDIFTADNCYVLPKSLQSIKLILNNNSMPLFAMFADIYGQQITSLNLTVSRFGDDSNAQKLLSTGLSQMKQLRQLKIVLNAKLTDDLLAAIGQNCCRLKVLDLIVRKYSSKVSPIFESINKHMFQQLRRLSLECLPNKSDKMLVVLTASLLNRLTHLTLRRLDYSYIIGDEFFSDIHYNFPRLQYIHCDGVSITEKSIQAMGQLAHLMYVDLRCHENKLTISESYIRQHLLIGTKIKHLFINIQYPYSHPNLLFSYG